MKKSIKILVAMVVLITVSTSLSASSLIRDISGKENKGITITYNGQVQTLKDGHGEVIYPVIIDGSTYLPVRAVTEMVGADITWNGTTKTIDITTKDNSDGAVPTDLPPSNDTQPKPEPQENPQQPTPSPSNSAGTLEDPVPFGSTYVFNDRNAYDGNETKAHFEITVLKADPITRDGIAELGFQKPEDDPLYSYVMLTLKIKASNVTYTGSEYRFLSNIYPHVWGSSTPQGNSIIGGTDYGFTKSFNDALDYEVGFEKVENDGKSHAYEVEGKVLLPIFNNLETYFVMEKSDYDLDDRCIYFKLK
ncbi:hypothetical protein HZI73_25830 [Vallitalea pronyensis]|uniref:Copper amine oxidase-like N-terminal domain-containing protein n=1 Tax=Vallitalea pronyensis TaxID=1348613 RepID=A0A8J8MQ06_9FIRM|nr:stalk domain-containing protein [Vallitalea pronyensis]QUI25504.1 hypothetical protein HZI73_25830 [Vallitalea pronyensis]